MILDIIHDKEYVLLNYIESNPSATQRDLSHKTGLSLGSINLLLKKMAREGLVKISNIPANRFAYMLTPKGVLEKANKTVNYLKIHYRSIEEMKQGLAAFIQTHAGCVPVQLFSEDEEMEQLLNQVIGFLDERGGICYKSIQMCTVLSELDYEKTVLVFSRKSENSVRTAHPTMQIFRYGGVGQDYNNEKNGEHE